MENVIKLFLKLCDENEINILKAALIVLFPLYLTGELFFPTFHKSDFFTQFSLITGTDILLNFLLLFLTNFVKDKKSDFQYRAMTYISLLTISISITFGLLTNFHASIPLGTFSVIILVLVTINLIDLIHKKNSKIQKNTNQQSSKS